MKVVLASASPRRTEILAEIFEDFEVLPQDVVEVATHKLPSLVVKQLAVGKLEPLMNETNTLVIACDTLVYRCGEFFGKPDNAEHAKKTLKSLSGKTHKVYSGVALYLDGKLKTFCEVSKVKFNKLTDDEIDAYVAGGSPMDKSGCYGIQDGVCVESYKGSLTNILGLPKEKLIKHLNKFAGSKLIQGENS